MYMVRISRLLPLLSAVVAVQVSTAQQPRVYIAPDDHTDYFWTADDTQYRDGFIRTLDYYLRLADSTESSEAALHSRWNCDGWMWLWEYKENKSTAEYARLLGRIRSGHISVPLNALVSCYGGMPAEAVLRGMYWPGTVEREHGLRFRLAVAMENQTLPLGLASLWAGAGAEFSWRGICGCATRVPEAGDREHEIYWYTGLDGRRILMKWQSMPFGNANVGGYAEARDPAAAVDVGMAMCNTPQYPYSVAGLFGAGWDDYTTMTNSFIRAAHTARSSGRDVVVSNEEDFFENFRAVYGPSLPEVRRSYGNEWELLSASMPETSARVRRAAEKLRAAESMAVMVLPHAQPTAALAVAREKALRGYGLYWEHDWTADGRFSRQVRADWQRRIADDIAAYSESLHDSAAAALARLITAAPGTQRFFVWNSLGWPRTEAADVAFAGAGPVHVVDVETAVEVPSQILDIGGASYLRIEARAVPAFGYRVYEIRSGQGLSFPSVARFTDHVFENDHVRLLLEDRGAIRSLADLGNGGREYVEQGAAANDLGPASGRLTLENSGPVSATVLAVVSSPVPRRTRITLYRASSRVDIHTVLEQGIDKVETWRFPFDIADPIIRHEEIGAVLRAAYEPTGHYARKNARTDWLTLNHFVDVAGSDAGITLSNADCAFMRVGGSTASALDTVSADIRVLAGGQVDGTHLGIPTQDLDDAITQRFSLLPHRRQSIDSAMRFALAHQNPLVVRRLENGRTLPAYRDSLFETSPALPFVWSVKPAEDEGPGEVALRVWNYSSSTMPLNLRSTRSMLSRIARSTHIETPTDTLPERDVLQDTLPAGRMQTYLYKTGGGGTGLEGDAPVQAFDAWLAPSPSRDGGLLHIALRHEAEVFVTVFDALGRRVSRMHCGVQRPGTHQVRWNTVRVAPGVYTLRIDAGTSTRVVRALLLR
ncbi:MAG: glycoside hydrolase [Ignavibacteriae bacterium]|nr:glycoside hydrolase [Ignavibacteriota bacterium]